MPVFITKSISALSFVSKNGLLKEAEIVAIATSEAHHPKTQIPKSVIPIATLEQKLSPLEYTAPYLPIFESSINGHKQDGSGGGKPGVGRDSP